MRPSRKVFSQQNATPGAKGPALSERGNAMVYVLIVVALFAALSFVLSRHSEDTETGALSEERAEIYAGQLMQATMQMKQALDQMVYTGAYINNPGSEVNFATPSDAVMFASGSNSNKLFHPEGGGAVLPRLPEEAKAQATDDPPAGWYVGRFNNVEWTPTANEDVIMTAHQIAEIVCARLNLKLAGDASIPEITMPARELLIDMAHSSAVSNSALTATECPGCNEAPALCVAESPTGPYSFYSILAFE